MHGIGKIYKTDGSVIEAEFDEGQYVDQNSVKITVAGQIDQPQQAKKETPVVKNENENRFSSDDSAADVFAYDFK